MSTDSKKDRTKKIKKNPPIPPPPTAQSDQDGEDEMKVLEKISFVSVPLTSEFKSSLTIQARLNQLLAASQIRKQSFWETVCTEIEGEFMELDIILSKLGLPPYNYRKDKVFILPSFDPDEEPPPMDSCITRVYLDYYIFPVLLAAIQAMINYGRKKRVFQCRFGLFNPLDYIVEYLYANNPKHPERKDNMIPLMQIPFAAPWLNKYPRRPYPKWLRMSADEAARIIQRCVRMWLAKRKRKDLELKRQKRMTEAPPGESVCVVETVPGPVFGPYYDEVIGESGDGSQKAGTTHSYQCLLCSRFRQFVQEEENRRQARAQSLIVN